VRVVVSRHAGVAIVDGRAVAAGVRVAIAHHVGVAGQPRATDVAGGSSSARVAGCSVAAGVAGGVTGRASAIVPVWPVL